MPKKVSNKAVSKTPRKPSGRVRSKPNLFGKTAKAVGPLTDEQIRQRAYKIFREGRNPSDPTADWFQAERELRDELGAR